MFLKQTTLMSSSVTCVKVGVIDIGVFLLATVVHFTVAEYADMHFSTVSDTNIPESVLKPMI